jgi:hypothetical protein
VKHNNEEQRGFSREESNLVGVTAFHENRGYATRQAGGLNLRHNAPQESRQRQGVSGSRK